MSGGATLQWMQFVARIVLTAVVVLLAGCTKPLPRAVFEVGEAVPVGTGGAVTVPNYDRSKPSAHVVGITRFQVERASVQPGVFGQPTIYFELVAEDCEPFRAWTTARSGSNMAVMVDHEIVTVAWLSAGLAGAGSLDFGANPPSTAELMRLAQHFMHD